MPNVLPYERILREYLRDELRVLNSHLPLKPKSLLTLLGEDYPHVVCHDSSAHLFKKKELKYLASLLDIEEQEALWLPILIETSQHEGEMAIICREKATEKVISQVLHMPVTPRQGRITIYRPQLALLRKTLKTTTQYVFSPRTLG